MRRLAAALLAITACSSPVGSNDGGTGGGGTGGGSTGGGSGGGGMVIAPDAGVPRATHTARATEIPNCAVKVDAANGPIRTIAAGVAAADAGEIVCVAEGTYAEALTAGDVPFSLFGGFQAGMNFTVRDSSRYVTKAQGDGSNTFLLVMDPGPPEDSVMRVDGFEITGYSQGVKRTHFERARLDVTNNYIHDNRCMPAGMGYGGGVSLYNTSGTVSGNVIARNTCGRGAAVAIFGELNTTTATVTGNWIDANVGDETDSHGGGVLLIVNQSTVTANEFTGNRTNGWGAGLYVGAEIGQGVTATANVSWNVYRNNRATVSGGGFFCDDSATCNVSHELYERNCGGNVFVDDGAGAVPTLATFDHLTVVNGLTSDCSDAGAGLLINKETGSADRYTVTNSIFWGHDAKLDIVPGCDPQFCAMLAVTVSNSDVQRFDAGTVTFGAGILDGADPLFVSGGDHHLKSTKGHWTPAGFVNDGVDSPALAAGGRAELGVYGGSVEASKTQ